MRKQSSPGPLHLRLQSCVTAVSINEYEGIRRKVVATLPVRTQDLQRRNGYWQAVDEKAVSQLELGTWDGTCDI